MALIFVTISSASFAQSQCSQNFLPAHLKAQLLESPELQSLQQLSTQIAQRITASDHSVFSRAFEEGNNKAVLNAIGYSEKDIASLEQRMESNSLVLFRSFPELAYFLPNSTVAAPLSGEQIVAMASIMTDGDRSISNGSNGGVNCAWVPYTASLGLCTAAGPVMYFACAAVALCAWCSGGYVSSMCAIS